MGFLSLTLRVTSQKRLRALIVIGQHRPFRAKKELLIFPQTPTCSGIHRWICFQKTPLMCSNSHHILLKEPLPNVLCHLLLFIQRLPLQALVRVTLRQSPSRVSPKNSAPEQLFQNQKQSQERLASKINLRGQKTICLLARVSKTSRMRLHPFGQFSDGCSLLEPLTL